MKDQNAWQQAERILCVRLDTIGDVLMTTPAIKAIRKSRENAHITLLTSTPGAKIVPLVPEIDDMIVYDSPWLKATAPRESSQPEYDMIARLRDGDFDAAVIFTVYSQNPLPSAFLCYMADIPLRLAHCHENPYQLLTNWVLDPEPKEMVRHEVQRQLDLVATVGCHTNDDRMSLRVPAGATERVRQLLYDEGVDLSRRWVVMHVGATAPSRRYPPDKFAHVARHLVREDDMQVVFTGTTPEQDLVEQVRAGMEAPSYSLVGRLTLGELAALISLTPLLVSNNTGPVHIAAAVGTPVVDLYALTNPQHTPWRVPNRVLYHDVPCRICYKSVCPEGHHNCLRLVSPAAVVNAVHDLLDSEREAGMGESTPLAGMESVKRTAYDAAHSQSSIVNRKSSIVLRGVD